MSTGATLVLSTPSCSVLLRPDVFHGTSLFVLRASSRHVSKAWLLHLCLSRKYRIRLQRFSYNSCGYARSPVFKKTTYAATDILMILPSAFLWKQGEIGPQPLETERTTRQVSNLTHAGANLLLKVLQAFFAC